MWVIHNEDFIHIPQRRPLSLSVSLAPAREEISLFARASRFDPFSTRSACIKSSPDRRGRVIRTETIISSGILNLIRLTISYMSSLHNKYVVNCTKIISKLYNNY